MINKKPVLTAIIVFCALSLFAQIGGTGVYQFLNLPVSSRTSALGGVLNCVKDDDVSLAIQNPGLLNPSMDNHFEISYINYIAGVNFGTVAYAKTFDSAGKKGTFMAGMQYINYGTIIQADDVGNILGTFTPGEYNYFIGYGNQWRRFSYGAQLKFIYSSLASSYTSTGLAMDLGGFYASKDGDFTTALVLRNMGAEIKPYDVTREPLPFEIQGGISEKLKHLPLRISVILQHLEVFDMSYINTNAPVQTDLTTGQPIVQTVPLSQKIAEHFIFAGELMPGKNFFIRFGYNYQRRVELTIPDDAGFVGFSYGFGFKISKFNISYGRAAYHISAASNTFTITTNFSEFYKRVDKGEEGKEIPAP